MTRDEIYQIALNMSREQQAEFKAFLSCLLEPESEDTVPPHIVCQYCPNQKPSFISENVWRYAPAIHLTSTDRCRDPSKFRKFTAKCCSGSRYWTAFWNAQGLGEYFLPSSSAKWPLKLQCRLYSSSVFINIIYVIVTIIVLWLLTGKAC